jgi:hypothetical protein
MLGGVRINRHAANRVFDALLRMRVRIVLGIDDTDPARTLFMPRLPNGWSEADAEGYPVMTQADGKLVQRKIAFHLRRERTGDRLEITADGPLAAARVRLGPYAASVRRVRAVVNGAARIVPTFRSGDSAWAWLDAPPAAHLLIRAAPL